jgi:putative serine protease PepD
MASTRNRKRKERAMRAPRTRNTIALAAALAAAAGGGGAIGATARGGGATPTTVVRQAAAASNAAATTGSSSTVGAVYRSAAPGVVEVTATTPASTSSPFPYGGGSGTQTAQGSGFVYDRQGHVITNQHVVDGATSVSVRFPSGASYRATVVGTDASTDLAVLKVDAPASVLRPLALADSSSLRVGDGVVAIGSPFGLEETVTSGIVSALHREIDSPKGFAIEDAIQTDAALNHGNSGGPLLGLDGRVVGVNAQIRSESGGSDGVGFAIPSNTVRSVVGQILATGKATHAYLGVRIRTGSSGAVVTQVRSGTPAARAGLRTGDVITRFAGRKVTSADTLRRLVDARRPGEKVSLTLLRNGRTRTVRVTLGSR